MSVNHHTKDKGDLGVLKAQLDLHLKGYVILSPNSEHLPFDLVAYKDKKFIRIQVKYRAVNDKGTIQVPLTTSWADKNGTHINFYDRSELDILCIYCPDTDKCYYIDVNTCPKRTLTLRVVDSKVPNKNVNCANDYIDIPDRFQ